MSRTKRRIGIDGGNSTLEGEREMPLGEILPPLLSQRVEFSLSLPRECASVRVFRVLQAWRRDLELGRYLNNKYKRAGSPSLMAGWCEIEEGGGAGYGATAAYIGRVKDGAKRERGRGRGRERRFAPRGVMRKFEISRPSPFLGGQKNITPS